MPIGLGVPALVATKLGLRKASSRLKNTVPLTTKSISPSPLTSLKYTSVLVVVLLTLTPAVAVTFEQPSTASMPKSRFLLLSCENRPAPPIGRGSPNAVPPPGPDWFWRHESPPPPTKTLSGRPSPSMSTSASRPSLLVLLKPNFPPIVWLLHIKLPS